MMPIFSDLLFKLIMLGLLWFAVEQTLKELRDHAIRKLKDRMERT